MLDRGLAPKQGLLDEKWLQNVAFVSILRRQGTAERVLRRYYKRHGGYSLVKERLAWARGHEKKLSPHYKGASARMMGWEMRIYRVFRGFGGGKQNSQIVLGLI